MSGFKDSKERVIIVVCSNVVGIHKSKLSVIDKSKMAHPLSGIKLKVLPVTYNSSTNAWITKKFAADWYIDFIKKAQKYCATFGLPQDCKILLTAVPTKILLR